MKKLLIIFVAMLLIGLVSADTFDDFTGAGLDTSKWITQNRSNGDVMRQQNGVFNITKNELVAGTGTSNLTSVLNVFDIYNDITYNVDYFASDVTATRFMYVKIRNSSNDEVLIGDVSSLGIGTFTNLVGKLWKYNNNGTIWYSFNGGAAVSVNVGSSPYLKFQVGADPALSTGYLYINNITRQEVTTDLAVDLFYPINTLSLAETGANFTANYTVLKQGFNFTNATYYIWYSNNSLQNATTISVMGNNTNYSTLFMDDFKIATYKWNVLLCGRNSTISMCSYALNNYTFTVAPTVNIITYNSNVFETASENFFANVYSNFNFTISNADLVYNGVSYDSTLVALSSSNYTFNSTIDIPADIGNKTFYYNMTFSDGSSAVTGSYYQLVNATNITLCGYPTTTPALLNFTFKNETIAQQRVSASFLGTFSYYLGSGTVSKTYSYISAPENLSYGFCTTDKGVTHYVNYSINYYNSYSLQRTYRATSILSSNSAVTLWLLPTSVGYPITFQFVDGSLSPLNNVFISISRGGYGVIEQRYTDSSGIVTFFLDQTATYTITAIKTGFNDYTSSLQPTQTSYTINMAGGTTIDVEDDYTIGTSWQILPDGRNSLDNGTTYEFNFSITSTFWDLDEFGFRLYNSSNDLVTSNSSTTSTGGIVSKQFNTGNNTYLILRAYWLVDGNYTNVSQSYIIINSDGREFSITRFFSDLKIYTNSSSDSDGLFGLRPSNGSTFAMALLVYLIIFMFAGVISYKYGYTSPAAVTVVIFALCLFFEYTLGLIDVNPNSNVPILSVFAGIFALGFTIKEVSS